MRGSFKKNSYKKNSFEHEKQADSEHTHIEIGLKSLAF